MRYLIGVTGGMGCGKSHTCRTLAELDEDVSHISMDEIGREIMGTHRAYVSVREQICERFGSLIANPDGSINRKELGDIVFSSYEVLDELAALVNPVIFSLLDERISKIHSGIILVESALFAEQQFMDKVDYNMLFVYASEEVQRKRLEGGDLPELQIENRIASQYPASKKYRTILEEQGKAKKGVLHTFDTTRNPGQGEYRGLLGKIRGGFGI